jgi:hypothetical protein
VGQGTAPDAAEADAESGPDGVDITSASDIDALIAHSIRSVSVMADSM